MLVSRAAYRIASTRTSMRAFAASPLAGATAAGVTMTVFTVAPLLAPAQASAGRRDLSIIAHEISCSDAQSNRQRHSACCPRQHRSCARTERVSERRALLARCDGPCGRKGGGLAHCLLL